MIDQTPAATPPVAQPELSAAQLIAVFIDIRDKIAAKKKEHAKELAPLSELKDRIDGLLLAQCQKIGVDALKAAGIGSATMAVKTTASLEDPDAFRNFVITNQQWDMVTWAAKVEPCEQHATEHGALPPGVKLSSFQHMNVRRASKKAGEDEE